MAKWSPETARRIGQAPAVLTGPARGRESGLRVGAGRSDRTRPRLGGAALLRYRDPVPLIAPHSLAGVSGISRVFTPSGRSASSTAPASAGIEAVQPDSPTPFTPSGLTLLGVGCSSQRGSGIRPARGM